MLREIELLLEQVLIQLGFFRQLQSCRRNARRHKPFLRNKMNANNLWGSVGSMAGKFMSSFGNGVSKGMNATVAAVSGQHHSH